MKQATGGAVNSGTSGQNFETEWSLQLDPAQIATGDTIHLRIYDGSTAIAAYTSVPTITALGTV